MNQGQPDQSRTAERVGELEQLRVTLDAPEAETTLASHRQVGAFLGDQSGTVDREVDRADVQSTCLEPSEPFRLLRDLAVDCDSTAVEEAPFHSPPSAATGSELAIGTRFAPDIRPIPGARSY